MKKPPVGTIGWFDLTVKDAKKVRDFYAKVVGWKVEAFDMGGYDDYCMQAPATDKTVAGVCHRRGVNAKFPPQWLIYITVKDIAKSVAACKKNGGRVIVPIRDAGQGKAAVIRDPAGAVCALYEPS